MLLENASVIVNTRIRKEYWLMDINAPQIARQAKPGQFIMVTVGKSYDPYLKRPMGINLINRDEGRIRIIYQVLGHGTKLLTKVAPGSDIDILGPLGRGWHIDDNCQRALLMGGGSGTATLLPLAQEMYRRGIFVDIILGARNVEYLSCQGEFAAIGPLTTTTIDGSYGVKGMVTDIFPYDKKYDMVYACGPMVMMEKVVHLARKCGMPCQVSLEENMGCGYGVCMGCICEVRDKDGQVSYKRICQEGPVFDAEEVFC